MASQWKGKRRKKVYQKACKKEKENKVTEKMSQFLAKFVVSTEKDAHVDAKNVACKSQNAIVV